MNRNRAPKVATWLLRIFGSSPNIEAIVGDLDERYASGRSRLWYWKQVLTALAGTCKETETVKSLIVGWFVFWTLFTALFPFLGRCTVLVSIAGFISGFTVASRSPHGRWWGILLFSTTVSVYWVCLGITSSPYSPVRRTYKMLALELSSRSAQVSTDILFGNLMVLICLIWSGAIFSSWLDAPHSKERKHEINRTA